MKRPLITTLVAAAVLVTGTGRVGADCPSAHTHIGKNPTWRPDWSDPVDSDLATDPDDTDDNQLWFFSVSPVHPVAPTPGWPEWGEPADDPFLWLVPETDEFGDPVGPNGDGNYLYVCRFGYHRDWGHSSPPGPGSLQHLDGWHSAHGPQGVWNLESISQESLPDWSIFLRREDASVTGDDFFMLLPNDQPVLTSNGSTYHLEKQWLEDQNAWGVHEHMGFCFWLPEYDPQALPVEPWVEFTAHDAGQVYDSSDVFRLRFVQLPEPSSLAWPAVGLLGLVRRWPPERVAQS